VRDVNEFVGVVFPGLSTLVVEDVTDEGEVIRVSARTRDDPVPCPVCGQPTGRVHGFHGRVVADVPVDGRRVVTSVRVRRLVCPVVGCPQQTFREQVPGVVERYQRRTSRLANQLGSAVKELAVRAGSRLSRALACAISRSTVLRTLMCKAAPPLCVPRALGIDDFALKRQHRYAAVIIDAETGERIDVLPDRTAQTLVSWLREHARG
jgi:transposase